MYITCRKCKNILEIKTSGDLVLIKGTKFCEHCDDITYKLKPKNQHQFDFKINKK